MNLDDPKLTAFALDELDEPERSTMARAVAGSPEAQRVVNETRELARTLRMELVGDFQKKVAPRNLIDIRDDPWFWSVARPLAVAAAIAIFAVLSAIAIGTYKSRHDSTAAPAAGVEFADVEGGEKLHTEVGSEFAGPNNIPNPLRTDAIQQIERVVIGELGVDPHLQEGEMRVIEIISDPFRVQRLKGRLTTRILSKQSGPESVGHTYQLMFLDGNGRVVASTDFCRAPGVGFVLHPSKHGYVRDGHYFPGRGDAFLSGDWQSDVDYSGYIIPFPDWSECIGYSPGA
jgi:hypothetical protein